MPDTTLDIIHLQSSTLLAQGTARTYEMENTIIQTALSTPDVELLPDSSPEVTSIDRYEEDRAESHI